MRGELTCAPPRAQLILGVMFALSVGLPCAEGRIFTNKRGKTIDAEMVGASSTHVRLKKNDRVFNVSIDTLSETDQIFIRQELDATRHRIALEKRIAAIRNASRPKTPDAEGGTEGGEESGEAAEPAFDATNTDFVDVPDKPA
jgi:hypothetical protein